MENEIVKAFEKDCMPEEFSLSSSLCMRCKHAMWLIQDPMVGGQDAAYAVNTNRRAGIFCHCLKTGGAAMKNAVSKCQGYFPY